MASSDQFIESRKRDWKRLENLLDVVRSQSLSAMTPQDLEALGYLYRRVTSDLAIAQRDFPQQPVTLYLNELLGRAHPYIYHARPVGWSRVWDYVAYGFPRAFRQSARYFLIAFGLFAVPALITHMAIILNPDLATYFLPDDLIAQVKQGKIWTEIPVGARPLASSAIMTNNIRVAMLALGSGLSLGIGTVYVLVMNGLNLGAALGLTQAYGLALPLTSFISPHGYIELSVIFMAGGAGLMLGHSLLQPGLYSRKDSLMLAAQRAMRLLLGCIPLLVIAGTIEGFVSPSEISPYAKLLIGPLTALLLYGYLLKGKRQKRRKK